MFVHCAVSSDVTEGSEDNVSLTACKQAGPEDIRSHDVSESSPRSESAGPDQIGEERENTYSVREPETTAPQDAKERSVGSEFLI